MRHFHLNDLQATQNQHIENKLVAFTLKLAIPVLPPFLPWLVSLFKKYSHIQQIFKEHFLYARHCSRCLGYIII